MITRESFSYTTVGAVLYPALSGKIVEVTTPP